MNSISNENVRAYCQIVQNILAAKVDFLHDPTAKTITITDSTVYPTGDSRKVVSLEVFDYFGNKVAAAILPATTGGAIAIDVSGLNNSRGFALSVLVVSIKGARKDGSQFKIANSLTSGSFMMEK
jgi:hypothetical protein